MEQTNKIELERTHPPVACTLGDSQARLQALEWTELKDHALTVESIVGGVRMVFPSSMLAEVEELSRRESACCTFLTITNVVIHDALVLDVTSEDPQAAHLIGTITGLASS